MEKYCKDCGYLNDSNEDCKFYDRAIVSCDYCGELYCEIHCSRIRHKQSSEEMGPWKYICPHCLRENLGPNVKNIQKYYV